MDGEAGLTPGLYQQKALFSDISSITSVITLPERLFIMILVNHGASVGAPADWARSPLFCSTCQCGFSLPARSG